MITSASNPRLKLVRRLRSASQRRRLGLFVVEGEDAVEAAARAGITPVDVLRAGEDVEPALLASVSELPHPARVVAVFRRADLPRLAAGTAPRLGVALWHVSDPGNVGTLLRTADAFGAFVALSAGCGDLTSSKSLRASVGAVFRVPTADFDDAPGPLVALVARGGTALGAAELPERVTLVLGSEREGVPQEVLGRCDAAVTIPVSGEAESLNVAVAGAIALYEHARRQGSAS